MSTAVASPGNEVRGHSMNFSSPPLPGISFGFRGCFNLLMRVLEYFWRDRQTCDTCFSLVIFEIFTVKLAAAAEFQKLEGGKCPNAP